MQNFNPTLKKYYHLNGDNVIVEIEDSEKQFAWRLIVNGEKSNVSTYYEGILEHKGYFLATGYWDGTFLELIPFKLNYCIE